MSSIAPSSQSIHRTLLLPPWLRGRWGSAGVALILYTLAFLMWIHFHWGGEENKNLIVGLSTLLPTSLNVAVNWRVALQKSLDVRFRRAWFLFGLAALSFMLGEVTWTYLTTVLHAKSFPSIADVFLLVPYPLLFWGLLALPGAHLNRQQRTMFWFDLLIMLTTASMFTGYFLIVPTAQANNTDPLTRLLAIAYPIADLILLSGLLSLLLRLPEDKSRAVLRLLLIGLTFFVISDLAFAYVTLTSMYVPGTLMDAGWLLAKLFMILGALRQLHPGPDHSTKAWWVIGLNRLVKQLPFLSILLGFGLIFYIALTDFNENVEWLFIMSAFLTVFMLARQVYVAGFSATSIRTRLILTFLLVSISSLELVSILTYFSLRSHPASVWQVISVTTILAVIMATGAAIFLAQRFVAPISRLTHVASQIAAGNLNTHAEVESKDEIGVLASTFNTMLETLSRTQVELKGSEALYRSLVEYSPDMIIVLNEEKVLFMNPAGVKLLGANSADEFIGKSILNVIPPQDLESTREGIAQVWATRLPTPLLQQKMHRLDGTSFEAEFRAIPILHDGKPVIQFIMRDITERKRLEEQRNKFKLGIERSDEAVFMTAVDGTILYLNPSFEKVYGYQWDEAVGKTPRILKSGTLSPEVYQHFWEKLLSKGTVSGEIVNRTKDGRLINIEGSNSPILDQGGNLIGFLSVHRDVTERKQAEEQIRQNAARAEALARVASILNSQLDLSAVAQAICEQIARALTVPVVTVRLVNEHNDGLFLVGQIGRQLEQVPAVVPLLRPAYKAIIQQPSSMIMLPEWNHAENEKNAKLYAELDLRAGVHASIVHSGRMIGMLSLKTIGESREFTSDELALIKGLADQAGLAISNAQLFAEVERQKDDLEVRVAQRTEELESLNQRLQEELAERQQLLKSLRDRERQLAQAVTLARIAYWELDLKTAEFTFNDQFYNVLRTTAHKVGGYSIPAERYLRQFVHPDDVDRLREGVRAAQASGSNAGRLEYRCICGDGQIQHALLEYQIVSDSPGHPSKIFAAHMDITERQQLFQSLRESEEHFRLLFEASPDAILLIDPSDSDTSWPIVDCNDVACKMNGYTREEMIGQSIDLLNVAPGDLAERAAYLEFLHERGVLHQEGVHRHKDGHTFPVEVSSSIIGFAGQALVLGIDRDITERKQVEEKLRQAKELAEAASRAKSDFLSRMSHELRTPMNAILGFAQLLEMSHKDPLTSNQKERVNQIVKGGQHLLDLINEILDIARIEANRLQVSPEPVSVRDSIHEAVDLVVPLAVKRHIQVVTKLSREEEHAFVMADRQRFKQVLLNLLSNAVKYNYDGGSVILTCEQRPSGKWRISIADTGPGIPQEQMGRLFEPFERLVADESSVEGTGLGLTLAKRLVELMHGQIGVDSAPGSGSTFWIELPATESPVEHLQRMGGTRELPLMSATSQTILYVEDNVANFELIREVFADYSQIELLWAADPKSGIESALQHHPSLILLDLHFGDRDGSEVLQQLKHNEATAGIPVVIVSADATPRQAERLIALGAHAYLTKPLNVKHFIRLMEELLGEKAVK